ncbi:ankyrin repeat protein [Cheloniid poxvirus 1]|nr:ankyrin repeat protein [Cheloniid poxvirus 1]
MNRYRKRRCYKLSIDIHSAIVFDYREIVTSILESGYNVNSINDNGLAPLHYAIIFNRKYMLKLLFRYPIDIDIISYKDNYTPLHYAVICNNIWCVKFLLVRGADVNKRDASMRMPIDYAILYNNKVIIEYLLNFSKYSVTDSFLKLQKAIRANNKDDIKKLLDNRIYGRDIDKEDTILLHCAVKCGNIYAIELLLEDGVDVNTVDSYLSTPLHYAINLHNLDMVTLLMKHKADTSIKDGKGITPFYYAMYLSYYGVNRDILNTIIRYNSVNGTIGNIKEIIDKLIVDECGNVIIILHDAARLGYYNIVKQILENCGDIKYIDYYCNSVLHCAVKSNNVRIVDLLLRQGIDVNKKDSNDRTAIHYAVIIGNEEIISSILEYGPDICSFDILDQSPLTSALQLVEDSYYDDELFYENKKVIDKLLIYLVAYEIIRDENITKKDLYKNLHNKVSARIFVSKCMDEIHKMKDFYLKGYSIYDIYINKNNIDIDTLSKRIKSVKDINLDINFPIHKHVLEKKFDNILERQKLIHKAVTFMNMFVYTEPWKTLPLEIKYIILEYLSNKDLRVLLDTKLFMSNKIEISNNTVLQDITGKEWVIEKLLGFGGFGKVYEVSSRSDHCINNSLVAKIENLENETIVMETLVYNSMYEIDKINNWMRIHNIDHLGIPKYYGCGYFKYCRVYYRFILLEKLYLSTNKIFSRILCYRKELIKSITTDVLITLEYIHSYGISHGDIKPENIMLDINKRAYLIDYGIASHFMIHGKHIEYRKYQKGLRKGTVYYASLDTHNGAKVTRRGDLESLGYCMLTWMGHKLSWKRINNVSLIHASKCDFIKRLHEGKLKYNKKFKFIYLFIKEVTKLSYEERPDYKALIKVLD